jgi:hypothetical protein
MQRVETAMIRPPQIIRASAAATTDLPTIALALPGGAIGSGTARRDPAPFTTRRVLVGAHEGASDRGWPSGIS